MRVIAHRGCPDHGPENTVAAARTALPHVDWIEVDARRCGSGEVVVHHDETLDRTTDATGRVDETPLAELRRLRVQASDEPVPTLAAFLGALPADVTVNVECKEVGVVGEVVALAEAARPDVVVSAFDPDAVRAVRAADGGETVPVAPLIVDDWTAGLDLAAEVDADYLHPLHETVSPARVRRAHEVGVEVNAWTLRTDDAGAVAGLRSAGVDGLVVDTWTIL
jgi:glycerophosphoryl diester phosphodiesterase